MKNLDKSIIFDDTTIIVDPKNCTHTYSNFTSALRYFGGDKYFDYYYCRICDSEIKKKI